MDSDLAEMKRQAAEEALREVRSGMTVGLGTGSTANEFIRALAREINAGRLENIRCVATSHASEELAASLGIHCESPEDLPRLDLSVDGADEIDAGIRLIKGRGGAMLREKIIAQASSRYLIIADESKLVNRLGRGPLPVEIVVFATTPLMRRFENEGLAPAPRMRDDDWFVTDGGHRIIDVSIPDHGDITDLVDELKSIAGVVETGFFPREASEVIIATAEGVQRKTRPSK